MAKYVFSYRVPSGFVPGSPESVAAWQSWLGGMGSSLADLGEAVIEAAAVGEVASGTTRLAGYSVVVADDMDAALAIAKGCPALQVGGGVEVGTVMEVTGRERHHVIIARATPIVPRDTPRQGHARAAVRGDVPGRRRRLDRKCRAADHPDASGLLGAEPAVGGQRLSDH